MYTDLLSVLRQIGVNAISCFSDSFHFRPVTISLSNVQCIISIYETKVYNTRLSETALTVINRNIHNMGCNKYLYQTKLDYLYQTNYTRLLIPTRLNYLTSSMSSSMASTLFFMRLIVSVAEMNLLQFSYTSICMSPSNAQSEYMVTL